MWKKQQRTQEGIGIIERGLLNLINNAENYVRTLSIDNRLQSQLQRIETHQLGSLDNLELEKSLSSASSNVVEPITHIAAASIISSKGSIFDIGYVDNASIEQYFTPNVIEDIRQKRHHAGLDSLECNINMVVKKMYSPLQNPLLEWILVTIWERWFFT